MDSTEILARGSYHRVSESLEDRHPYYPEEKANLENFSDAIRQDQVTNAHGRRACPKLVAVLNCKDFGRKNAEDVLSIKQNALLLLVDFVRDQRNQVIAINEGVIEACSNLLSQGNDSLHDLSSRVLTRLVGNLRGRKQVETTGSIMAQEAALLNSVTCSEGTRMSATEFFCALSTFEDGVRAILDSNSFVPILSAFSKGNTALLPCIAQVTRNRTGRSLLLDQACTSHVVAVLGNKYTEEEQMGTSAEIVSNLAMEHDGKLAVIAGGGVIALTHGLKCSADEVRRASIAALCGLSVCVESKDKFCIPEVVTAMLDALVDEHPLVCTTAAAAIRQACALRKTLLIYVPLLVSDPRDCTTQEVGQESDSHPVPAPLLDFVFRDDPKVVQTLLEIVSGEFEAGNGEVPPAAPAAAAERLLWHVATQGGLSLIINRGRPTPLLMRSVLVRYDDESCYDSCIAILKILTSKSKRQYKEASRFLQSSQYESLLRDVTSEVQEKIQNVFREMLE